MIDELRKTYWEQRTNLRERYQLKRAKYFGPYPAVWDSKVLFIHVPKTAGSSIARLSVGRTFGHQTYRFYEEWCPKDRDIPPTFAVVRNPFSRYVSAFRYLNEGRGNHLDTGWGRRNNIFSSDLNSFAVQHLKKPAVQTWMHFKPQIAFTEGSHGSVDTILRFENLSTDWPSFARQFGLDETLPKRKVASPSPIELNDDAKAAIRDIYQQDFAKFGYEDA